VSTGRCALRWLRVDSRALAAVRGVHRADHQIAAGLRTRPCQPGREARRRFRPEPDFGVGDRSGPGADGALCERPDVGRGERGKQPGGHRQLFPEAGRNVQRGAWARRGGQTDRVDPESAGGRTWSTMKPGGLPVGITWSYDRGYMVAASDRATAERAIAT